MLTRLDRMIEMLDEAGPGSSTEAGARSPAGKKTKALLNDAT